MGLFPRRASLHTLKDGDALVRLTSEALAWCVPRVQLDSFNAMTLRSSELSPGVAEFNWLPRAQCEQAVLHVITRRKELLLPARPTADFLAQGRVLLARVALSICSGESEYECRGFVDQGDVPAWDSWITVTHGVLLAAVPNILVPLVEEAIRVNPYDDLEWVSTGKSQIARNLRRLGLR